MSEEDDKSGYQTKSTADLVVDAPSLRRRLRLERPRAAVAAELALALESAPRSPLFARAGLCGGYPLRSLADRYFVAQEFGAGRVDLRNSLDAALAESGVSPVCADDSLWSGHILCKISALIQSTPFGVYQLSVSQNRNVYLELGIGIGLGRPFVLVKDRAAVVPPLIEGLEYYSINSYIELRYELGEKVWPYLASVGDYRPPPMPEAGSERTAVIAHGDVDALDFCVPIARAIASCGLTPVILGDTTGKLSRYMTSEGLPHRLVGEAGGGQLDETLKAIQAARFGIYRVEKRAAPDAFLAFGISVGLGRPGFLLHLAGQELPSDVKGLSGLGFNAYSELAPTFLAAFARQLESYC